MTILCVYYNIAPEEVRQGCVYEFAMECSFLRKLMYSSLRSHSGTLLIACSEGSHSGTLMYSSLRSHSGTLMYSRVANGTGSPLYAYNFICSGSSPLSVLRSKIFFANYYSHRVFSAFILHILKITLKTWRYTI